MNLSQEWHLASYLEHGTMPNARLTGHVMPPCLNTSLNGNASGLRMVKRPASFHARIYISDPLLFFIKRTGSPPGSDASKGVWQRRCTSWLMIKRYDVSNYLPVYSTDPQGQVSDYLATVYGIAPLYELQGFQACSLVHGFRFKIARAFCSVPNCLQ